MIGEILEGTFGSALLKHAQRVDEHTPLVSPEQARRKVIVKAKYAKWTELNESVSDEEEEARCTSHSQRTSSQSVAHQGTSANSTQTPGHASEEDVVKDTGQFFQSGSRVSTGSWNSALGDAAAAAAATVAGFGRATTSLAAQGAWPRKTLRLLQSGSSSMGEYFSKDIREGLERYNRCIYIVARKLKRLDEERLKVNITSFSEDRALKLCKRHGAEFNRYHQENLTRVYPPPTNLASGNLQPMPFWTHGAQLVALNYQITDRGSILNEGIFREQNGGCGYVLKPPAVLEPDINQDELMLWIHIRSGHFLPKPNEIGDQGFINPYIIVSIDGIDQDRSCMETGVQMRNGLNPEWNERWQFTITRRDLAILTFEVRHYLPNYSSHPFVAAAAFPVSGIRSGTRWVALWDDSRRPVENCGLLVEVELLAQPVGRRKDSHCESWSVDLKRCMTGGTPMQRVNSRDDGCVRRLAILHDSDSDMNCRKRSTSGSSVDISDMEEDIDD